MKTSRFLHYIVLMLAVWFPLDNALAGAVVEGCPMMPYVFERGMSATDHPTHSTGHCLPSDRTATADHAQLSTMNQCGEHCCNLCLLLGGAALTLPIQHKIALDAPHGKSVFFDFRPANLVVLSPPLYRPPII